MITQVPPEVRANIEEWLRADESKLGKVFRGEWPETDYECNHTIASLLGNERTTKPQYAVWSTRKFKKMRNWEGATPELLAYIEQEIPALKPLADAYAPQQTPEQLAKAKIETERYEELNIPGVYVYTMPLLLEHPMNEQGFILLKIGQSERCYERYSAQAVATANPQRMVLQRIYKVDDGNAAVALERTFHRLLDAAGHDRSDGGREWFITTLEFLDEIATALDKPVAFMAQEVEP